MAEAAAAAAAMSEDENSVVSDHSFVILGQGSLHSESNEEIGQSINSQHSSLTNGEHQANGFVNGDVEASRDSTIPDNSSIEIQLKLEKLVKENLLLKETLNQSNLAMKNQFDTLALWHEEIVRTHESHKQKFQETQNQIFKLRNENLGLKKLIQHNLDKCCGSISDLESMNSSLVLDMERNTREINFHYMFAEELRMRNAELEKKLDKVVQEKLDLEKKLDKVVEEKLDLEKKLKEAVEENDNLKKEMSKSDICIQCQGSNNSACNEESKGQKEKCNDSASLDPEISIINKLSKSVEAELVMSASKQEFAELKKQFDEQSAISHKNSEKLQKMIILYHEIVEEKNKLKNELELSQIITEKLTHKVASLNEELKIKDEQLQGKVNEFEQIKKEMQKLVLDCEEVAILRAQVELYQSDFNEERRAREQAVNEKEKMAEQVRFLEMTLTDFNKREKENGKKASNSSASTSSSEGRSPLSYVCPKCMKKLPTLTACESHVDVCLDLDNFP